MYNIFLPQNCGINHSKFKSIIYLDRNYSNCAVLNVLRFYTVKWYASELKNSFIYTKFYEARNFQLYNKAVIIIYSFVVRKAEWPGVLGSAVFKNPLGNL